MSPPSPAPRPRARARLATLAAALPALLWLALSESLDAARYSRFYRWNETRLAEGEAARRGDAERFLAAMEGHAERFLAAMQGRGRNASAGAALEIRDQSPLLYGVSSTTGLFYDPPGEVDPDMCFVVVTGAPRDQKYLSQTVAFLLARLSPPSPAEASRVKLAVFVPHPSSLPAHPEARALSRLVRVASFLGPANASTPETWSARLSADRARAYRYAHAARCRFAVVLEDDAVAGRDALARVTEAAEALERAVEEWGFVKLFYTEFWNGWSVDPGDIAQLFLLGAGCGVLLGLAAHRLLLPIVLGAPPAKRATLLLTLAYFAALSTLALWAAGKQTLAAPLARTPGLHPRGPGEMRAVGVAHLHPRRHLPGVAAFLEARAHNGAPEADDLLDEWAFAAGVGRWELLPHVFQHVGVVSSGGHKNQGEFRWVKTSTAFYDDSVRLFGENGDLL